MNCKVWYMPETGEAHPMQVELLSVDYQRIAQIKLSDETTRYVYLRELSPVGGDPCASGQ